MIKQFSLAAALLCAFAALQAAPPRHQRPAPPAPPAPVAVRPARVVVPPPPVAVRPAPVVVKPAPVVVLPPPVVVKPVPVVIPNYGYGYWNDVWVPCYNNWYWYKNAWVWGGKGPRPVPPRWVPDFKRRPMPPPPPRPAHHRPAPPRGPAPRGHR